MVVVTLGMVDAVGFGAVSSDLVGEVGIRSLIIGMGTNFVDCFVTFDRCCCSVCHFVVCLIVFCQIGFRPIWPHPLGLGV